MHFESFKYATKTTFGFAHGFFPSKIPTSVITYKHRIEQKEKKTLHFIVEIYSFNSLRRCQIKKDDKVRFLHAR